MPIALFRRSNCGFVVDAKNNGSLPIRSHGKPVMIATIKFKSPFCPDQIILNLSLIEVRTINRAERSRSLRCRSIGQVSEY